MKGFLAYLITYILMIVVSVIGVFCFVDVYTSVVENGKTLGELNHYDPYANFKIEDFDLSDNEFHLNNQTNLYELSYSVPKYNLGFDGEINKYDLLLNNMPCYNVRSTKGVLYAQTELSYIDLNGDNAGKTEITITIKFYKAHTDILITATNNEYYGRFKEYKEIDGLKFRLIKGQLSHIQENSSASENYHIKFVDNENGYVYLVEKVSITNPSKLGELTFPILNKEGFDFLGWSFDGKYVISAEELKLEIDRNMTLYPVFETVDYSTGYFNLDNEFICSFNSLLTNKHLGIISGSKGLYANNSFKTLGSGILKIPNTIEYISNLQDCYNLKKVELPKSVTSIGQSAFSGCINLLEISIPNTIMNIGSNAFYDCKSLEYYTNNGAKFLGNNINNNLVLCSVEDNTISSFEIDSSTRIIYNECFKDCDKLTSIEIPSSVVQIGDYAFSNCSSLSSVNLVNGNIKYIGSYAFANCSFRNIFIPISVTNVKDYAFVVTTNIPMYDANGLFRVIYCEKSANEISSLYSGFWNAYYYNNETSYYNVNYVVTYQEYQDIINPPVLLPEISANRPGLYDDENRFVYDWQELIGGYTDCEMDGDIFTVGGLFPTNGTKLILSPLVRSIASYSFMNCANLKHVSLSKNMKELTETIFSNCPNLQSIFVPSSILKINRNFFISCPNVKIYTDATSSSHFTGTYTDYSKFVFNTSFEDYLELLR